MSACAFCNEVKPLTREHVWSNVLLRLFQAEAPMTFDPSRKVVHHGEPQLRDVCVDCNNNRLSSADAAMGMFAERHLTAPISVGTAVDLSDPALFRWSLKTLANLQRHGGHDCVDWRRSVNFILGDAAVPAHTDLFFAAWHDLSPGGANGMLEGLNIVHKLDAREARFMFLPGIDPSQLAQDLDGAWALKVGSGIFLVLFWKSDLVTPARTLLSGELVKLGWVASGSVATVRAIPFNAHTCAMFNLPCPVDKIPFRGKLNSLDEVKKEIAAGAAEHQP